MALESVVDRQISSGRCCRYKLETNSLYAPLRTLFLSFIPSFNLPPLITVPFPCVFLSIASFFCFFFLFFVGEYLISLRVNWPQMDSAKLETFPPTPTNWSNAFSITSEVNKASTTSPKLVTCDLHWAVSNSLRVIGFVVCLDQLFEWCAPMFATSKTTFKKKKKIFIWFYWLLLLLRPRCFNYAGN